MPLGLFLNQIFMATNNFEIMNISQLSEYIKLDKQTIYGLTSNREIPFTKPTGKLLFIKSDIDKWLMDNRRPTRDELNNED